VKGELPLAGLRQDIIDMIDACSIFITPLEHRKGWNEYKQDAADRLAAMKTKLIASK